jgi:hypothetical protein
MTFEEFKATRKWFYDIRQVTDDDYDQRSGYGYQMADGMCGLAIEHVRDDVYSLTLDREIYESTDLEGLERKLFTWADEQGYFDDEE